MDAVSIKGTKNGLVIKINPDVAIEEIKTDLSNKMEKSQGFFRGAKFTLYFNFDNQRDLHKKDLEDLCQKYGLIPSDQVSWPSDPSIKADDSSKPSEKTLSDKSVSYDKNAFHNSDGEQVLLINRTLRSGQMVFSEKSVVVMGDVNPGAEVISARNIYIMGTCNGIIHAGCPDNSSAEVVALKYQPIVLRIGKVIADDKLTINSSQPITAKAVKGRIVLK
ncbi:MAG: septum site-determining protein MinC [Peptococcaceae bacterium]|nr:septum site-determining protein MinC [Peptococcaceae bacterium]